MAGKMTIQAARRHFSGTPPHHTLQMVEPRSRHELAQALSRLERYRTAEDVLRALAEIRDGRLSQAANLPGMLDCLGGLGLVRLHGRKVSLRSPAHDLLAESRP